MFRALLGAGWLGNGRKMAVFVERSDFWSGAEVAESVAPITEGLLAGTLVATEIGWQRVEDLRPGDRVVTFDNGMQVLRGMGRGRMISAAHDLPRAAWPLHVPPNALGNRREMVLLPGQAVLIESDAAEALHGDPFALVQATALDGWNGIARIQPEAEAEVWFPEFDADQIVYAEGMALVHCPCRAGSFVVTPDELVMAGSAGAYALLPPAQGRALVAAMAAR